MMRLGWLLVGGTALAAPVKGTLKLPDEPRAAEVSGYWRVENGLLPILPAPEAREAVVVLEPASPQKGDPTPVTVELHGLRLDPRVLAVPVGATVEFKNSDRVPHTLFIDHPAASRHERGATAMPPEPTPAGQTRAQKFLTAGEFKVLDEEYPHVWGMVLAVASPFAATVDATGAFKLEAPEGKYTARVWWRGAWVLSQPVSVGHGEINLVVKK